MSEALALTVEAARADERRAVANLLQLYLHDFSEIDSGIVVDNDGLFAYPFFDEYWADNSSRAAYVFKVDDALAGFAFVNDWSPSGQEINHGLAEFFVLRAHRRSGIGWEAASRLFEALPGVWEVAVRGANVPAVNFWRTALRADSIRELKEIAGDGQRWNGTIFRFSSHASVSA